MKILGALLCLTAALLAHAPRERPAPKPDRIVNEKGQVELWTWTRDYRGHPKVTIRNLTTGAVRVFVF